LKNSRQLLTVARESNFHRPARNIVYLPGMRRFALAIILLLCIPKFAHAWGADGHQIVARIAEDRLTPAAKAAIHDLIGNESISDSDVASWPDAIRNRFPETGPWHYVDIPANAAAFDEKRDGDNGNNVIEEIEIYEMNVDDKAMSKPWRIEALKFIVHFVGDLHQPLHCAERNGDRGGNSRLVFFLDTPRATNLHSVWDSALLFHRKGDTPNQKYADDLNAKITPAQAQQWSTGTSLDWANESFHIAVNSAYANVPADGPPPKLDINYVQKNELVVEQQLQKGGVRLAMVLNQIFTTPPTTNESNPSH
jgi:S1/P1 Nuclease